jgi:hypothetical protein
MPTVTLTREDFVGVMRNAVSGLGLAPDAAMVTFPSALFLPGSDIGPVEARRQEFYDGLTRWRSSLSVGGGGESPLVTVEAATYEDALVKANHLMLANQWGDGLPVWPATRSDPRERYEFVSGSTMRRSPGPPTRPSAEGGKRGQMRPPSSRIDPRGPTPSRRARPEPGQNPRPGAPRVGCD